MWNHLPSDLLAQIFFFLPPHTLAQASTVCKQWRSCTKTPLIFTQTTNPYHHPPWFLAMTARTRARTSYAYNPTLRCWHSLPLDFLPNFVRQPVASVSPGLILCKPTTAAAPLSLALCNPFTQSYKLLPPLNTPRSNPAIGFISDATRLRIYVAGGMSEAAAGGGAGYEPTMEIYDSNVGRWQNQGEVPMDFTVRLTIWAQSESVYCDGVLYWITSARAFSVMGFELRSRVWKEVKVPMAERLECAALVLRKGRVALFGGMGGGEACVWELGVGGLWRWIERVPLEMGQRFVGSKGSWVSSKCVGGEGALYFFRDSGSEMLVWREVAEEKWEWSWVQGCCCREEGYPTEIPIKGLLLQPSLVPSILLD